jgi:hypothetical protein
LFDSTSEFPRDLILEHFKNFCIKEELFLLFSFLFLSSFRSFSSPFRLFLSPGRTQDAGKGSLVTYTWPLCEIRLLLLSTIGVSYYRHRRRQSGGRRNICLNMTKVRDYSSLAGIVLLVTIAAITTVAAVPRSDVGANNKGEP